MLGGAVPTPGTMPRIMSIPERLFIIVFRLWAKRVTRIGFFVPQKTIFSLGENIPKLLRRCERICRRYIIWKCFLNIFLFLNYDNKTWRLYRFRLKSTTYWDLKFPDNTSKKDFLIYNEHCSHTRISNISHFITCQLFLLLFFPPHWNILWCFYLYFDSIVMATLSVHLPVRTVWLLN